MEALVEVVAGAVVFACVLMITSLEWGDESKISPYRSVLYGTLALLSTSRALFGNDSVVKRRNVVWAILWFIVTIITLVVTMIKGAGAW